MRCPDEPRLDEFVSGEMTPSEQEEIQRHVDECASCAAKVTRLTESTAFNLRLRSAVSDEPLSSKSLPENQITSQDVRWRLIEDDRFAQALMELAACEKTALDQALASQQSTLASGSYRRLCDILVECDVVTRQDVERAFREIGVACRYCPECQQRLLVRDATPGKRVRCPECRHELTL